MSGLMKGGKIPRREDKRRWQFFPTGPLVREGRVGGGWAGGAVDRLSVATGERHGKGGCDRQLGGLRKGCASNTMIRRVQSLARRAEKELQCQKARIIYR
jgi:hypothetical protein